MREYNDVGHKKYILKIKDLINELCTELENEVFRNDGKSSYN